MNFNSANSIVPMDMTLIPLTLGGQFPPNDQIVPDLRNTNSIKRPPVVTIPVTITFGSTPPLNRNINSNNNVNNNTNPNPSSSGANSQSENQTSFNGVTPLQSQAIPSHLVDIVEELRARKRRFDQSHSSDVLNTSTSSSGSSSSTSLHSGQGQGSTESSPITVSNGVPTSNAASSSDDDEPIIYRVKRVKTSHGRFRPIILRVPRRRVTSSRVIPSSSSPPPPPSVPPTSTPAPNPPPPPPPSNININNNNNSSNNDETRPVENASQPPTNPTRLPFPIRSLEELKTFDNRIGTEKSFHKLIYSLFGRVCATCPNITESVKKVLQDLVTPEVKRHIKWDDEGSPRKFKFRMSFIHRVLYQGVRQPFPAVLFLDIEETIKEWILYDPEE